MSNVAWHKSGKENVGIPRIDAIISLNASTLNQDLMTVSGFGSQDH